MTKRKLKKTIKRLKQFKALVKRERDLWDSFPDLMIAEINGTIKTAKEELRSRR